MRLRLAIATLMLVPLLGTGCPSQESNNEIKQQPPQTIQVPIQSQAEAITDGPRNSNNLVTNPHGRGIWDARGWKDTTMETGEADGPPSPVVHGLSPAHTAEWLQAGADSDGDGIADTVELILAMRVPPTKHYDYSIHGNTVSNTITSDLASTQTQSPQASGTGTQSTSADLTGGGMEQRPEASTNFNANVPLAPGSTAQSGNQQSGTGATQGGDQSSSPNATSSAVINRLRTDPAFREEVLGILFPNGLPGSPPAPTPTPTTNPAEGS